MQKLLICPGSFRDSSREIHGAAEKFQFQGLLFSEGYMELACSQEDLWFPPTSLLLRKPYLARREDRC
ncbi:hypothetical protein TNCV_370131 [Trichonephila clavipes]|nr:hypothetical protein TNCV_370131 [Trichonephila clavipes]